MFYSKEWYLILWWRSSKKLTRIPQLFSKLHETNLRLFHNCTSDLLPNSLQEIPGFTYRKLLPIQRKTSEDSPSIRHLLTFIHIHDTALSLGRNQQRYLSFEKINKSIDESQARVHGQETGMIRVRCFVRCHGGGRQQGGHAPGRRLQPPARDHPTPTAGDDGPYLRSISIRTPKSGRR